MDAYKPKWKRILFGLGALGAGVAAVANWSDNIWKLVDSGSRVVKALASRAPSDGSRPSVTVERPEGRVGTRAVLAGSSSSLPAGSLWILVRKEGFDIGSAFRADPAHSGGYSTWSADVEIGATHDPGAVFLLEALVADEAASAHLAEKQKDPDPTLKLNEIRGALTKVPIHGIGRLERTREHQ